MSFWNYTFRNHLIVTYKICAWQLLLTPTVTVASVERKFSKIKLIKYYRSINRDDGWAMIYLENKKD